MFALIERLIFFLFLLSAIRSGLQFILRAWRGSQTRSSSPAASGPRAAQPQAGSTLLHQDPVCGTYVAADASLKRIFDGKVVHFCSAECRDRYRA
jgi:YHS domain-containing protein